MFFDTIGAVLSAEELHDVPYQNMMRKTLHNITDVRNDKWENFAGVIPMFKGELRLKVSKTGIRISQQSFSKLYYGNNVQLITRKELTKIIHWLCHISKIPFDRAGIKRLDYGPNICLTKPPVNYLRLLGRSKNFNRLEQPTGLYYNRKHEIQQVFYDKGIESNVNNRYLMRYELRLKKNIKSIIGVKHLSFNELCSKEVEDKLIEICYHEYNQIDKLMDKYTLQPTSKPSDLKDQLAFIGLIKYGQNEIEEIIESWRKELNLNPTQIHRMKNQIRDLKRLHSSNSHHLVEELNQAIETAFKQPYHR